MIIDTSDITVRQLREKIIGRFSQFSEGQKMIITIVSFGFSHGIPLDADLVFDVRFLPNPYYVDSLRELDGNNQEVADYVLKWPVTTKFLSKLYSFIDFLIPQYINEGKDATGDRDWLYRWTPPLGYGRQSTAGVYKSQGLQGPG